MSASTTLARAVEIYDDAAAALGVDAEGRPCGCSVSDLLCDNMPITVARARELAALIARRHLYTEEEWRFIVHGDGRPPKNVGNPDAPDYCQWCGVEDQS